MRVFKYPLVQIFIVAVVIFSGGFLALYYQSIISAQNNQKPVSIENTPVVAKSLASNLTSQNTDVNSPDGKMKLIMKMESSKDGSKKYSFSVSDISGNNSHPLFSTTLTSGEMTLPENSWSPDNSYVFVQDIENNTKNIYVMKASGESFASNQQYLDVTSLFTQKVTNYSFDSATGWAAPTLLIVNTMKNETEKGPSFWFDVPSQAFLQLAH